MTLDQTALVASAQRVLQDNRVDGVTVPNRTLYPAMYLWDSAIITRGMATYDPTAASAEVLRYLTSQWTNGMLANEVYFERNLLKQFVFGKHPEQPPGCTTSGITQPPLIVRAVLDIGERLEPDARQDFYRVAVPALARWAQWVARVRIGRNGVAVLIHPYETGMDNRVDLTGPIAREWLPQNGFVDRAWLRVQLGVVGVARRLLGDTRFIPIAQRSSNAEVLSAFHQSRHIRGLGYDLARIEASGRGVLIEDAGYNGVLLDAFECLRDLVPELGDAALNDWAAGELTATIDRLADGLDNLWQDAAPPLPAGYYSRDYRSGDVWLQPNISCLYPLLRTRDPERRTAMLEALSDPQQYLALVAPPSVSPQSPDFEVERYWRGPAWPFPLEIIETALVLQDEQTLASELRRRYLRRPSADTHPEYQNALTGEPLGASSFSPSAALAIRFVDTEQRAELGVERSA